MEIPFFGEVIGREATKEERQMTLNHLKQRSGEISRNTIAVEISGIDYSAGNDPVQIGSRILPVFDGDIKSAFKAECQAYNTAHPILKSRNLCSGNEGDFQANEYCIPSGEGLIQWASFAGGWGGSIVVEKYGVLTRRRCDPCANL